MPSRLSWITRSDSGRGPFGEPHEDERSFDETESTEVLFVPTGLENDDAAKRAQRNGVRFLMARDKRPLDRTYFGILRELLALPFPIVVNTEIVIPDQARVINQYKWQQRKMMAAQHDISGGFRVNVEAQVAERQLVQVLEDVISSSLKTCRTRLIIVVRTSQPARTARGLDEAERILADRRERAATESKTQLEPPPRDPRRSSLRVAGS